MGVHKREREMDALKDGYVKKTSCILLVVMALLIGAFVGNTITMLYMGQRENSLSTTVTQGASVDNPQNSADPVVLAQMEKTAAANPTVVDEWVKLGNYCFDHDLPLKAIKAYERALELSPMKVDVWSDLGVMYRRAKQFKKAIEAFGHAAALDEKHITSRFNMGVVYLHDLGDKDGALKAWNEVLKLDPNAKSPSGQSVADLVKELKK